MTTEEQQQVNARFNFLMRQIANMAEEGANTAMVAEGFAIRAKNAEDERDKLRAELDALKPKPASNVIDMEPAA